jgi:ectoine hydroxylase-related dioxygenase (phytanoyl-CoA dioxygenase family)
VTGPREVNTEDGFDFREDGVVCVRGALSARDLEAMHRLFAHEIANPGPLCKYLYPDDSATVYTDFFNRSQWDHYRDAYEGTAVPSIVSKVWGCQDLWLFFEQVWWKSGGRTRRTPWHQDASYTPIVGDHQAIVWIPLDEVSDEHALEFVRGSHRGPVYRTSNFAADDDTSSELDTDTIPPLPEIELARASYDIVSWGMAPGDILIFNFATLHGGGATPEGGERRTVSLRYFGPDAVYQPVVEGRQYGAQARGRRGAPVESNPLADMMAQLPPGSPYSSGTWPKLVLPPDNADRNDGTETVGSHPAPGSSAND